MAPSRRHARSFRRLASRPGLLVAALAALGAAGCGADRPHNQVLLVDGSATYTETAEGLAISGAFVMIVNLWDDRLDRGDESEVYLNRLQLARDYTYEIDGSQPLIEEVTSSRPLPFVAEAGSETSVNFQWTTLWPPTVPSALCDTQLTAEVYVSLTDELSYVQIYGDWSGYGGLAWAPDPCAY